MYAASDLDCIIVGYHDLGFSTIAKKLKHTQRYSGGYRALKADSVLLHGERIPYMDLLNYIVSKTTPQQNPLHVTELPALGPCYLKNFLQQRGLHSEIVNSFTYEQDRLRNLLLQSPRAVAITTTFYVEYQPIADIVKFIRTYNTQTRIIVGGPHIYNLCSSLDETTLYDIFTLIGADFYIFDSQGELTLSNLLHTLRTSQSPDLSSVPNLFYAASSSVFTRTHSQPENNNLDTNSVDWSLFERNFLGPTIQIRTARSCSFACAFCSYPAMAVPLTLMSLDTVKKDLDYFQEIGVQNLVFVDDTFNVPLPRFKRLCRLLANYNFRWFSYFRCSNADDEAFALMQQSGCAGVFLGIESGDQSILNNMNKYAQVQRYIDGIQKLNARGIMTFASLIVGFPGETAQTIENTINFIEEAAPTFYRAELFYHDTMVKVPVQEKADLYGLQGGGYSWHHNTMSWQEACDWIEHMYKTIHHSLILPSYMFNFWSIPYLVGKGISLPQIQQFSRISQEMLIQSLDDQDVDFTQQEQRLLSLFQER